ncbi:NusA-like transcription termination signal-binding factor [Candidatus Woesearchaeota archaeon]|nr:NusA-like transcription termination signal-binding factor [Candidatus Woesearchaeota archaeon]
MANFVLDQATIYCMQLFEQMTRSAVRDCITGKVRDAIQEFELTVFIVEPGEIGKAIGPRGAHVHKLEQLLNRRVKITEWNDEIGAFAQNLFYPAKVANIEQKERKLFVTPLDNPSRGQIIGRGAIMLRFYEGILKRYFPIDVVQVVEPKEG